MSTAYAGQARLFKALGDPHRLHILALIRENGEMVCKDLIGPLRLKQPSVSHHLGVLAEAGLLTADKQGVWTHYRLVPGALDDLPALRGAR
jgi:ArsR family transcriptional regulator